MTNGIISQSLHYNSFNNLIIVVAVVSELETGLFVLAPELVGAASHFVVVAEAAIDEAQIIDGDVAFPILTQHRFQLHLEIPMVSDRDCHQLPGFTWDENEFHGF